MGKRFAILIGAAALGVMALGAQTAAPAQAVVKYDTKVTLRLHFHDSFFYSVQSKVRKCEVGRRVVLFEVRPGADRKLGTARSSGQSAEAVITAREGLGYVRGYVVYARVRREVHDEFVCRRDRSELHVHRPIRPPERQVGTTRPPRPE